jgi:hypothetical protein
LQPWHSRFAVVGEVLLVWSCGSDGVAAVIQLLSYLLQLRRRWDGAADATPASASSSTSLQHGELFPLTCLSTILWLWLGYWAMAWLCWWTATGLLVCCSEDLAIAQLIFD